MPAPDPARRRPPASPPLSQRGGRQDNSLITPHKPGLAPRFGSGDAPGPDRRPPFGQGSGGTRPPSPPLNRPRVRHRRPRRWKFPLLGMVVLLMAAFFAFKPRAGESGPAVLSLSRGGPVDLPPPLAFPDQDTVRTREGRWVTRYAPDIVLQARTERYVNRYQPEGAVVVVCDLRTGQVRALVERDSNLTSSRPRLALGTTFPAASLAKIVTAAAVLEEGIYRPSDDLPLVGGAHTLYRSQLRLPAGRHNTVTLREAFARSINPTFGMLGLRLGSEPLHNMAARLGFDRPALPAGPGEDPVDAALSQARLEAPDSGFALAEVASGYTTATTISPLHALRIARAIGQDGRLLPARFTRELESLDNGRTLVLPEPEAEPFASPATLHSLRTLMEATVTSGTARRGFRRNLDAEDFARLDMGGKTGSLNGHNPPGRYEWFIGYARRRNHPDQGIAVAVMLINRTYLAVHATELAGLVIRDWARYSSPYPDEDGNYLARR